jgi:Raf kinase inhibitor-like YbhB/YbcL family protein
VQNRTLSKTALLTVLLLIPAVIMAATVIKLEILSLKSGAAMPKRYTAQGRSVSPPLTWSFAPQKTLEYALIMEDLDDGKVHWLMYRIPGKITAIPEGISNDEVLKEPSRLSGTIQGTTGFREKGPGYTPPVSGRRYQFTLYALDAHLGLLPGLDKESLMVLIQGHIIGKGEFPFSVK